MATFYWVGGSGSWSNSARWSTSSGGSGGAGVPTSADNVIFDAGSDAGGAFVVTVDGTSGSPSLCADFTASGLDFGMTLTMGATAFLDCYGSMTLPATNFTVSGTNGSRLTFRATTIGKTVTTNGVAFTNVDLWFFGTRGAWTLGSALTCDVLNILTGSLTTNNFNITVSSVLLDQSTSARTVTLGSSTITSSSGSSAWSATVITGLTFNAGTSSIICSATAPTFAGGGLTYYNVSFASTASGTVIISGTNTFNDLSVTSLAATGRKALLISANQIINGTLTLGAANTAIRRVQIWSSLVGTPRTLTVATMATLADVDFRDITISGAASPVSGTRLGNAGGNSGITFDAGKTVYRVGTGNWSATQWSLLSGGAVDVNNFPLAQDTCIFDTGTVTGTHTIDAGWFIGSLNMSALNVAVTLASGVQNPEFYGDITLDSDVTITGTGIIAFAGASTQTIISAGRTFTQPILVNKPVGVSLTLADNAITSAAFTLTQGALTLSNNTLTCLTFSSSNSNTRSIEFGTSGKIVVSGIGGTLFGMATASNFTYTGTTRIDFTNAGSTTSDIAFGTTGGTETNALNLNITAGNYSTNLNGFYNNVNFTGFTGSLQSIIARTFFGNVVFSSGMSTGSGTSIISFGKTSGTQTVTTNAITIDVPITKLGAGTLQLTDNLTMGSTRTFTHTAGTLDLNGYDLTCGLFNSNSTSTRSIAFGSNAINITGNNASVVNFDVATNFTCTGSKNVNLTYAGSVGTRTIQFRATFTESSALNINVTAGTDIVDAGFGSAGSIYNNLNFTGFAGTLTLNSAGGIFAYGNVVFSSGMTMYSGTGRLQFLKTSSNQTLTTNGKTLDFPVAKQGAGTLQLLDACTIGSTRTLTHTDGTLDLNDFDLTTGLYSSTGSTARQLDFGTGDLNITGATFTASGSNFTTAGTGSVSMNSASSKTFAGGGFTYSCALNQGGLGNLTITGANTFADITNTTQPATVTLPSNTTTNLQQFSLQGTAGNLISLRSSTAGQRATINML